MRFGKISDPAPQTHPGILFFTNSKKYENTLGFLKIWGVLKQNGQNHAFLNSGGMSYPFKGIAYIFAVKNSMILANLIQNAPNLQETCIIFILFEIYKK